ncbi:Gfo/Idh/MocA family protein [Aspergillus brunneoviolaceus CBS 621.78]|uniref:NAD binding Rossmann fold oxidoreductase n=1 Tax=Aspergillus brunneoviolaceus CBS 621.78 TaxID=1450534 RepID=A0ACD1G2M5_9EURO|nr:putative NAD binding Rossmann fold oxidoreductase [Aspergillus brunneoviolaceus CBS 621.78]RAH43472.1 putative NAD binding Rossmann fold oxidoreductase [Aspergillus brunneoviolaceus CBS 621.78]
MALVLQGATFLHQYLGAFLHSAPQKSPNALRLGVLSSAQINAAAVIHPVETHPDVILYSIASRDAATAAHAAKQYHFTRSHDSYQALLDDPAVDIVYISTPNGLHYEWAAKAIQAGKHVLCEKPFTSNAEEARALIDQAKEKGVTIEEAFHWQFHPAAHAFRHILESGEYGRIIRTEAIMTASPGVPKGDIRWQYDLAGGSAMDMTYALSFTRYALRSQLPKTIHSVTARRSAADPRVDEAMYAYVTFEDAQGREVHSRIYTDMARAWAAGGLVPRFWELPSIEVETDKAIIFFYNAMMPHLYHYIAITDKTTGKTKSHRQYRGGPLWGNVTTSDGARGGQSAWSTYRWQLEAFVDAVRGRTPAYWIPGEESIWQMECIDRLYRAAGLPVRGEQADEKE